MSDEMPPLANASFEYCVENLTFSDGTVIELTADDLLVIVGPNNAGKSAALREIVDFCDSPDHRPLKTNVVRAAGVRLDSTREALDRFIESALERNPESPSHVGRMGATRDRNSILQNAGNLPWLRAYLRPLCVYHVTTESRLAVTNPVDSVNSLERAKPHPFNYLYDEADLERQISSIFAKAFGVDLVVNRIAGSSVTLHVGMRPESAHAYNFDQAFKNALMALPPLHKQGDGMRAFVGTLLWITTVDYPIVLIDEPEAFLHPPQARLMGRTLATMKRSGRQLIISTHSGDLVRGLLDANGPNVRIVRLMRDGNVNRASELRSSELRDLWADPVIRQSNPLDGLFHASVVICEGDGDAHLYSALMYALAESTERTVPDVLFLNSGGKAGMAKIIGALRAVGVPVRAVPDFDVLREERPLRLIIEALGGTWADFAKDWGIFQRAVVEKGAQLDADEFRKKMEETLAKIPGRTVPDSILKEVRQHSRKASAWGVAKSIGEMYIPPGEATQAWLRFRSATKKLGLHIVPVGEIENFCKSIGGHGPGWVLEVCKRDLSRDDEMKEARSFVEAVFWPAE